MTDKNTPDDIKAMKFEDAMGELESIVKKLEAGEVKLDDAIAAYERGDALKKHCQAKLAEAQSRIDKIAQAADGEVTSEPASID
ncbi:MAG: exodeoxyribonuclease VII small subunit [Alphaproteobacteria bacterium]